MIILESGYMHIMLLLGKPMSMFSLHCFLYKRTAMGKHVWKAIILNSFHVSVSQRLVSCLLLLVDLSYKELMNDELNFCHSICGIGSQYSYHSTIIARIGNLTQMTHTQVAKMCAFLLTQWLVSQTHGRLWKTLKSWSPTQWLVPTPAELSLLLSECACSLFLLCENHMGPSFRLHEHQEVPATRQGRVNIWFCRKSRGTNRLLPISYFLYQGCPDPGPGARWSQWQASMQPVAGPPSGPQEVLQICL